MTSPIFIDTNVPIYAGGRAHELKAPCVEVLTLVIDQPANFVTDAEVLQELLHRYLALRLWSQSKEIFFSFADLMRERVEPILARDVEQAARLADEHEGLAARDLLHAAVMERLGVRRLVSADAGFDRLSGIERVHPTNVQRLRKELSD